MGIRGSYCNITKAIFYLLKGGYPELLAGKVIFSMPTWP